MGRPAEPKAVAMSMIRTARPAPFGAISVFRAVNLAERALRAVRAWVIAERTRTELSRLSPEQLRDIGLGERDLSEVAEEIARRRA